MLLNVKKVQVIATSGEAIFTKSWLIKHHSTYFCYMNFLGNLLWLVFGGFLAALGYFFGGLILCFTIIGIPFGLQCFKIGALVLWPFGAKVITRNSSGGCLSLLCNIIWIVTGGLYTAFIHVIFGLLLFITVIGIPFGKQHFKLAELSLTPFGKDVVYQ